MTQLLRVVAFQTHYLYSPSVFDHRSVGSSDERVRIRVRLAAEAMTRRGGGPPGIRTPNLRIKSPLLCQIELEARRSLATAAKAFVGVTEGTRTPDLRDHNPAL